MLVIHLEICDSSLIGWFPGNLGGGAPARIGVHIFMQMTPTWDAYSGWPDPSWKPGLGLRHRILPEFLPMMTCLGVVWCTQIPTENSLQMPDPNDSMIRLGLRIQQCHQLSCKKWFLHRTHCVHCLWRLPPWLHQGRILCIHCCHQLKKLACFAHWTSLNVKGAMDSRMRHLWWS